MRSLLEILNDERQFWTKKNYQYWLEFFRDDYFFRELKGPAERQYWINLQLLEKEEDEVHIHLLVVYDKPIVPGSGNLPLSTNWLVYKDGRIDA